MKYISLISLLIISIISVFIFSGNEIQTLAGYPVQPVHRLVENRTISDQLIKRIWKITDINLTASSVILIDAETGKVIYQDNSDLSLPTASMSKMMSELIVLEAIEAGELDWETDVTISDYAYAISHHPGYASVHLVKDQTYTVDELFQAMAIHSANGATIALAEAVSGSEELFVQQMNQRANELGLEASIFVNSTGLDNRHLGEFFSVGTIDDTNKMSAQDLATLARYLINHHPSLLAITSQPQYLANNREYINTNLMLADHVSYLGVDGLKTGYTNLAGYGFTGTVEQNGVRLVSVVMGTDSIMQRFIETEKLYEQAFHQLNQYHQ
ncbi:D-alanyl-D-alanine carboxypeptidase (penicillin-binding protein 5/6) [Natronobacillus azotifigens]|uniref:D-alanyl-D-alanine carboxypeptidase n=1 Tax=Natronobacillus azotifigens TaxID=472978 RepID=A0A9J6R9M4_9BACI|nr:D-alanyl-D-alanine carboxypeptidase family protein [Natronobacillus azotifigens]MCZ0702378.1 D-alanyl-D-alanine carboxypeptidase [Natronobacillus azotifigens]